LKTKYQFSENLIRTIVLSASGFLSPIRLDELISSFENEASNYSYTQSSESNLFRIINSIFDKGTFLSDCAKYPQLIEVIISVSSFSNFLTDVLVRNPEFIYLIVKDGFLHSKLSKSELELEIQNGKNRFPKTNSFIGFLKFFQRKYILKIGLRDILGIAELSETTEDISVLSYVITSSVFEFSLLSVFNKYSASPLMNKHVVIALGKMGGKELNYSSDIDLIVFFDSDEKLDGSDKNYFEILNKAIQNFTIITSEVTKGGFLYRVDFRLRPDGKFAPLARTLNDTINYYETRGELWEKQMLIKSSFVTGNLELYNKFSHFRTLFTFGQTFAVSPIEKIRKMKHEIEKRNSNGINVKTFWGGIRDIEFSVQALQLLNGKKQAKLQTPNTLEAILNLHSTRIISESEYSVFTKSYILFRKIEHFLQLQNNSQTHVIPENNEVLKKLSTYLGFSSIAEFQDDLNKSRSSVRSIFNSILEINEDEGTDTFNNINFSNIKRANKNLDYLSVGSGLSKEKSFDSKTIELFTQLEPELINYLINSNNPDRVLENFVKLVSSYSFHSILYSEFNNKGFFQKILNVCEYAQIAIDLLHFDKSLMDMILSRKAFVDIHTSNISTLSYSQIRFILSLQYSLKLIDENRISELLSNYITFHLNDILDQQLIDYKFFVAGLGSYGIKEMNFYSDVDLIVVVENITNRISMEKDFQNLLLLARKKFPNVEIDFRLRPEGKSSLLVWDFIHYKNYLEKRADYWEFQTLLKINFVSGNKNLFNDFKELIVDLFIDRSINFSIPDVKAMHDKSTLRTMPQLPVLDLKKSNGGFLTIDYLLQILLHQNIDLTQLAIGKNQIERINILQSKHISKNELNEIKKNYNKFKNILFWLQNYQNTSGYRIKPIQEDNENFVKSLGYDNYMNLFQEIMKMSKINYTTLLNTLKIKSET
jgi:[glutamine synthetase] adenylyltransferase / [glutamine synthetase]-adenylyl-L-tyrosine phosphorylase